MPSLWNHQAEALATTVHSSFQSGTHAHATGTGKSILGLSIISKFAKTNPQKLVIWVCEQSSVISEIFSRNSIDDLFTIYDLVKKKPKDWPECVGELHASHLSVLITVNRAFLVSKSRYERLKAPIGLVLHDECHSGAGKTMRNFYTWLERIHPTAKVVGLSATPPPAKKSPCPAFANIISRFSIYDATEKGIIVPLRMYWCELPKKASHLANLSNKGKAKVTKLLAARHDVSKIIVWCGTIQHCLDTASSWGRVFSSWLLAVDTSRKTNSFARYPEFVETKKRAILFCAAKHREGSDIPGLGMGVFVDGVTKRRASVFVQCVGRVLRKAKEGCVKNLGVILDLQASSGLDLCDRLGEYLRLPPGSMPWDVGSCSIGSITVRYLTLNPKRKMELSPVQDSAKEIARDIEKLFVRSLPDTEEYRDRLQQELQLIHDKELGEHLVRAIQILELAGKDISHVTRGSCGSSLVCYLLGISHVDPVKHKICFARFLNEFRDSLPDIDFDFPHSQRSDIFMRMALRWPGLVARISNHVHYHERSAIREALRRSGHKGNVPTAELEMYLHRLPKKELKSIISSAEELEGQFRCFSLHCGGVVYYPQGVPREHILPAKIGNLLAQVVLDKRDIADENLFKIDVLSSRALSQLSQIMSDVGREIFPMDRPPFTEKMAHLFARGDNIGITLAESPLIREEFRTRKPKSVIEVAACMALIRPAARHAEGIIVYDDDAIMILKNNLKCSEALADSLRRKLAKGDRSAEKTIVSAIGTSAGKKVLEELGELSLYGFCKSHAISYAQLVCWLAWCKVKHPQAFWRAALDNCQTSYRKWVHIWEARRVGVLKAKGSPTTGKRSIFARGRLKAFNNLCIGDQLSKYWYWNMSKGFFPGCYIRREKGQLHFRGVVAAHKILSEEAVVLCIGTKDSYLDIICPRRGFSGKTRVAQGVHMVDGTVKSMRYFK